MWLNRFLSCLLLTLFVLGLLRDTYTTALSTLSLHDALPILSAFVKSSKTSNPSRASIAQVPRQSIFVVRSSLRLTRNLRSEEHTSELQSRRHLVCRLLLEKKKEKNTTKQIR